MNAIHICIVKYQMLVQLKNTSMMGSIKYLLVWWFLEFENTIKWLFMYKYVIILKFDLIRIKCI